MALEPLHVPVPDETLNRLIRHGRTDQMWNSDLGLTEVRRFGAVGQHEPISARDNLKPFIKNGR